MKKIIFVCTGNTCRSPMAQMIMTDLLDKTGIINVQVLSRGLSVLEASPANPNVHALMDEIGIDASSHKACLLSSDDFTDNSIILTMTLAHKDFVCYLFPEHSSKVYTLSEYVTGNHFDIQDPYGSSLDIYRQCFIELQDLIKKLFEKTCLHYKKDVY